MSEEITPLTEVLSDAHSDSDLREKYAEYLPVKKKAKALFDADRHEAEFAQAEADGALLHNSARPQVIIEKERPEHRFLVFLYSQGMSTKDIFLQLGGQWNSEKNLPISGTGQYSYQHLHTIRRQAWFQRKLIAYMEECGKDVIRAKLEAELMPSIEKVIEIRDDAEAPKNIQLQAANSLIDRFLGKPVQQVITAPSSSVERFENEAQKIQEETEKIEREMRVLNPAFKANE